MLRILCQLSDILRPLDFEHLIAFAENVDGFAQNEIPSECDVAGVETVVKQAHLKDESV